MTAADPPIPPEFWEAIIAFLHARKSGAILLDVQNGEIREVDITDRLRRRRATVPNSSA